MEDELEIDSGMFDVDMSMEDIGTDLFTTEEEENTEENTEESSLNNDGDDTEASDDKDNNGELVAETEEIEESDDEEEQSNNDGISFNDIVSEFNKFGISELSEDQQTELDTIEDVEEKYSKFMDFQSESKQNAIYQGIDALIDSIQDEKLKQAIALATEGLQFEDAVDIITRKKEAYDITDDTLENSIDAQKKVATIFLKSTGMDDEEIAEQLEYLEMTDKLEAKSKVYHQKNIKNIEKLELDKKASEKAQKQQVIEKNKQIRSQYESAIDNTKEVIPGKSLTKKDIEGIKEVLFTKIQTKDGDVTPIQLARQEDPIWFDTWLAYQIKNGYHKKDSKAWDSVKKIGKTEQTSKILSQMKTSVIKGKGSSINTNNDSEADDFLSKFKLKPKAR